MSDFYDEKESECNCNDDCECEHEHGDGCECEHSIMTIITEDNEELKCNVIDIFEAAGREYIALLPEGDDEVLLYRYIENDSEDGFELSNIETDEEFQAVETAFFDLFEDGTFEYEEDEEDDE